MKAVVAQLGERETEGLWPYLLWKGFRSGISRPGVRATPTALPLFKWSPQFPGYTRKNNLTTTLKRVGPMDDILYDIEVTQTHKAYIAKMKSFVKPQTPLREYKGSTFEEILEQIIRDILDENDE